MKVALAIVSLIVGLYFLGSTVRMFPLGTVRPLFVRPTTVVDVVNGALTVLLFVITGVMLLLDASWWFLLVNPAIYLVVGAVFNRLLL